MSLVLITRTRFVTKITFSRNFKYESSFCAHSSALDNVEGVKVVY